MEQQLNGTEWQRDNITLADGGSKYAETDHANFIVEPWNALSSLLFLIPAIIWAMRIRRKVQENKFIAFAIPLLILGGLGSTFFHAFRSSPLLLLMDILPILVLTLSVSLYFWQKLFRNWTYSIITLAAGFGLRWWSVSSGLFSHHTGMNVSYAISGLTIFLPAILIQFRTGFQQLKTFGYSILLFVLALIFREADTWELPLSMGTHFLWHAACAAGAYYLAAYLHFLKDVELVPVMADEELEKTAETAELQQTPG